MWSCRRHEAGAAGTGALPRDVAAPGALCGDAHHAAQGSKAAEVVGMRSWLVDGRPGDAARGARSSQRTAATAPVPCHPAQGERSRDSAPASGASRPSAGPGPVPPGRLPPLNPRASCSLLSGGWIDRVSEGLCRRAGAICGGDRGRPRLPHDAALRRREVPMRHANGLPRRSVLAAPSASWCSRSPPARWRRRNHGRGHGRGARQGRHVKPGRVKIGLPELAKNGNSVPLKLSVESPMTAADHVKAIYVFSERSRSPTSCASSSDRAPAGARADQHPPRRHAAHQRHRTHERRLVVVRHGRCDRHPGRCLDET